MSFRNTRRALPRPAGKPQLPSEPDTPWTAPPSAATIWLAPDGSVQIGFPPTPGHTRGHVASLAASDEALLGKLLLSLLRERERAPHARVATPSAPTQYMLDAYAAALGRGAKPHREELGEDDFADFGEG